MRETGAPARTVVSSLSTSPLGFSVLPTAERSMKNGIFGRRTTRASTLRLLSFSGMTEVVVPAPFVGAELSLRHDGRNRARLQSIKLMKRHMEKF